VQQSPSGDAQLFLQAKKWAQWTDGVVQDMHGRNQSRKSKEG